MKSFIYLISPTEIKNKNFYKELNQILKTNKIKYFQLRLKKRKNEILKIAKKIKKITDKNNTKFIINDNPIIAKLANASGCHVGQNDMGCKESKKILGKKKIIGVTCHNSKRLALKAVKDGAGYIAFGSFFKSLTKKTRVKANLKILRWAKKKIKVPIIAIGGINSSNFREILLNGATFIACSKYIWGNKKLSPIEAIKEFSLKK